MVNPQFTSQEHEAFIAALDAAIANHALNHRERTAVWKYLCAAREGSKERAKTQVAIQTAREIAGRIWTDSPHCRQHHVTRSVAQ